ncbi:MAG: gamma-glutamyltransferase [Saprospiraceae bacterium]
MSKSLYFNKFQILFFITISLSVLFVNCQQATQEEKTEIIQSATSKKAMVVSAHHLATKIGNDILRKGGNAIDATIAVQYALAVVYPRAGNIGGGGFMVIRTKDGNYDSIDYREKAPKASTRDMYLDSLGNVIPGLSRNGHLAVGVPGTVDGMFEVHKKHGQLKDFNALIQPAIDLAANGFLLTPMEIDRLNKFKADFQKYNKSSNAFVKETPWVEGDRLVQKELAHTLSLIRDKGRAGFYEGETADKLVAEMKSGNGIITHDDLKSYNSKWRTPLVGAYKNFKVISMAPPSSGGIALLQMLKMVEDYPLAEYGFQSKKAMHLMIEAERRVYSDRAKHLGDNDFYKVPQDSLLEKTYIKDRMADFNPNKATPSDMVAAGNFAVPMESFETTHTSVIDADGNAVSTTTTLNSNYGSKVVVTDAGFFLNNEMDDFSAKPGVPNQFGLVGNEANAIEPEKRMLSSMTPTIVEKDGELFMVLGAPGGSTIITAVFQVFLNVVEFGMPLDDALFAKRFHHQWLPDVVMYENGGLTEASKQSLKDLGHSIKDVKYMALVKAIHVKPDGALHGVGDNRSEDHAAGY